MKMEPKNDRKFQGIAAIFFALILALFIGCGVFSYRSMQDSLYKERTANVSVLMEKTTQNVETEIQTQWSTMHHFRNMFEALKEDMIVLADAKAMLEKMRENHPENESKISRLFLLDEDFYCYQSDTTEPELWQEHPALDWTKDVCFISYVELNIGTAQEAHMFFLSPLFDVIEIEGKRFTAMGMAVEMSFINPAFDTKDFGEDSIAFIVQQDGTQLYRQEKNSPFAAFTDVVDSLAKQASFAQGVTAKDFTNAVALQENGTVFFRYQGEGYYATYYPIATKAVEGDWLALLLIPYDNISTGTQSFMRSTILSTLVICIGVAAVVAFIVFVTNYRMRKQLRAAAEAERSANQAKTQFLSAMSHDIRTPMNAIVGMTTLASKRIEETEYVKSCLEKISMASNHLLTLINDILDITKVESGKMTLNPIVFSLTDTVSNLINVIRPLVQEKLHDFEFHVHNICIENVYADELRLNQVLINILSNAVKYTPEGGKISVSLREDLVEDNPSVVRLTYTVEDNGVGMSEEFQKTMYQSFARGESSSVKNVQGSGLGLTICKQMVELMGGKIECESSVDVGTKFTVTVDLLIADKEVENLVFAPTEVLLVDDDGNFLLSATDVLLQLGLLPDCVESGEAAIRAVETRRAANKDYPLIILDWKMPGMDGLETARQIRARVGDEVSIIVVSAYDTEAIEAQAKEAGVNGFIAKPFFRSTVYNALRPLLESVEQGGEATQQENHLRGTRILVAEDNDLNWEIVKDLLDMYGVITVRAENGQACVDMIESADENDYDLILMDIQMPIMNGYEATKAIRGSSRKYLREIPIIAMTADAFSENIQQCKEVGMNAHVAKPVDIKILLDVIESRGGA